MTVLDNNRIPAVIATSNADGSTLVTVTANATAHSISVDNGTTGSNLTTKVNDGRDSNRKVAFMAVSNVDGVTPVVVYCDSTGKLLINSN